VADSNYSSTARPAGADPQDGADVLRGSWRWLVPLLGVIFVVLLVVSFTLSGSSPNSSDSGVAVIKYFHDHRARQLASALLVIISIPAGLFFFGLLREYLRRARAARPFAAIAFAGAVLFAAGGCASAGAQFALADVPAQLSPSAAQALNVLSNNLGFPLIVAGISAMQLGYGAAMLRSRLLPTWLGWLSLVIGVVALAGPIGFFAFLATGLWVLITSAILYRRLADYT
jgi:hypothetical protein